MNYHDIVKDDMLNGDGLRVTLFVAGCSHKCKGCQNPETWDPKGGIAFDEEALNEIYEELSKDYISGLTLTGGDPLYEANVDALTTLLKNVKERYPDKSVWLYTGSVYEEVMHLPIFNYVDVVVDGEYIEEERDTALRWRGSSNQRIIRIR